jgi:HlyD family secretion protein
LEIFFEIIEIVMNGLIEFSNMKVCCETYRLSNFMLISLVYWLICLAVAAMVIFSWSFVFEISTSSPGFIRPFSGTSSVCSAYNGHIKQSFLKENQFVNAGDTLFSIEAEALAIKQKFLSDKLAELTEITTDLKVMINTSMEDKRIQSSLLQRSWSTYSQKMKDSRTRLKKAETDYKRNMNLHSASVIADAEFETYKYELDRAINEVSLTRKAQLSQWQADLVNYEREVHSVGTELAAVEKEIANMIIRAPISGTVQRLTGVYTRSVVYVGQELAQISPDSNLIVEAYVAPNRIGLLHQGMQVRFLIDAFNYNQWGFSNGKIIDISNDIQIINDKPVFRIRCSLDRNYLQLKNGYKGALKKGMSLQARFIVTKRTLWQLIYDNIDDWLNPAKRTV